MKNYNQTKKLESELEQQSSTLLAKKSLLPCEQPLNDIM